MEQNANYPPPMKIFPFLITYSLVVFAPFARAEGTNDTQVPLEPPTESSTSSANKKLKYWTNHIHDYINRNFILYANKTDLWLSNNDMDMEANDASRLKLSLTTQYMDEEFSLHPSSKLRLALPRTHRRFQFILDQFSNETMPEGERDINDRRNRDKDRTAVGLRFIGVSNPNIHTHLDVGFSLPNIIPYVRANASWSRETGTWKPRLTTQVSWERDDGLGAKVPFETKRELVPRLWLKTYTEASWLACDPGILFVQDLSLHWLRTDRDAISPLIEVTARNRPYDFDENGHEHPNTFIERVWFSIRYRRQIYMDWLYIEFEPGFYYTREFDLKFEPVTRFKIEAVFGATSLKRDDVMDELAPEL